MTYLTDPETNKELIEIAKKFRKHQKDKVKEVIIPLKKLEEIADYYGFPLVVFFEPIGTLKGTRKQKFADAYKKLCKIREILEEDKN